MNAKRTCVMCKQGVLVSTAEHPVKSKVGSFTVDDQSGFVDKCSKCGETYIEAVALMGYENRAVTTVLLDAPERADGAVLRYARHVLGLTQAELAKLLGLTVTTIVRMEKSKSIEARVRTSILWYLNQAKHGVNVRELATARPKTSKSHALKVRAA